MKHIYLVVALLLLPVLATAQTQLVLNNDAFIVIENSAFVVLDNNVSAITTLGTGGNIISENEADVIKWNLGAAIGIHTIPWTTSVATGAVKIPLSINITTPGIGATASILLSTYETATDMNTPWQSGVTNMCSTVNGTDGSLDVADRFWLIDANTYATKPTVSMTIGYNPAANEIGITNNILETNLLAQRFNPTVGPNCFGTIGSWEGLLFGTNNAPADNVTDINVGPTDFFRTWILVSQTAPLPIELDFFDAKCNKENRTVEFTWQTLSELNNDYFVIEKSYDAINFFDIATILGAGTSTSTIVYTDTDNNPSATITYYRLKQVDFDGASKTSDIIVVGCGNSGFNVTNVNLSDSYIFLNINTDEKEKMSIQLFDASGRIIAEQYELINEGSNGVTLTGLQLSSGMYFLRLIGEFNSYSTKVMR